MMVCRKQSVATHRVGASHTLLSTSLSSLPNSIQVLQSEDTNYSCWPSFICLSSCARDSDSKSSSPPGPPTVGRLEKCTTSSSVTFRSHHRAVDPGAIIGSLTEIIKHVKTVLEDMGINITVEREYEYRCIRPTRSETGLTRPSGFGDIDAFTLVIAEL